MVLTRTLASSPSSCARQPCSSSGRLALQLALSPRSSLFRPSAVVVQAQHMGTKGSFYYRKKAAMDQMAEEVAFQKKEVQPTITRLPDNFRLYRVGVGLISDDWIPLEKDARPSWFSATGFRYRLRALKKLAWSTVSIGIVKRFVPDFQPIAFAADVQDLYLKMRKASASWDKDTLHDLLTDEFYSALKFDSKGLQGWQLKNVVDRPRVVHISIFPVETKKNYFAQVTVKLLLDREVTVRGVATRQTAPEFVVMERHISDKESSRWRLCGMLPEKTLEQLLKNPEVLRVTPGGNKPMTAEDLAARSK